HFQKLREVPLGGWHGCQPKSAVHLSAPLQPLSWELPSLIHAAQQPERSRRHPLGATGSCGTAVRLGAARFCGRPRTERTRKFNGTERRPTTRRETGAKHVAKRW